MKPVAPATGLDRRTLLSILPALGMVAGAFVPVAADAQAPSGTLPSWNDGPAKQSISICARDDRPGKHDLRAA